MALCLIAAGLEANTTRQHLYQELQLSEQSPPSSLDLAVYLAIDDHDEAVPRTSGADAVILQGQPLSVRFWVANESNTPQTAVEDVTPAAGRIRISGLMRGSVHQVHLPVTWTSPQLRNGASRSERLDELSLPAGSSVGWVGAVAGAESLARGVYELVVERTIKDSGGRPARVHTGALTLEVEEGRRAQGVSLPSRSSPDRASEGRRRESPSN
ncbi:MAG: hypothetical protein M3541_03610 [Acidobacteriota bacterium]|nr:hypothetical protein [Acidobacteriota bacterium]